MMAKCVIALLIAVCVFQAAQTLPSRQKREEATESNPLADVQRGIEATISKLQSSIDANFLNAVSSNITAIAKKAEEMVKNVGTAVQNAVVQPTPAA